jgi:hypothetical protein
LCAQGAIYEDRYQLETRPLQAALGAGAKPASVIDAQRVASYLQAAWWLFSQSPQTEQRRFVREVFERIVVSGERIAEILPRAQYTALFLADRKRRFTGDPRVVVWLPGLVPQSVIRDVFQIRLASLVRLVRTATRTRVLAGRDAVADEWRRVLASRELKNRAALARREGVSRARVTQALGTA